MNDTKGFVVNVHVVTLQVEERSQRLTKAIARQFPVLESAVRWRAMENGQPVSAPICKVRGQTLGHIWEWMYLVEDATAGLAWVAAMQVRPDYKPVIVERGGYVDTPELVPTVIL